MRFLQDVLITFMILFLFFFGAFPMILIFCDYQMKKKNKDSGKEWWK